MYCTLELSSVQIPLVDVCDAPPLVGNAVTATQHLPAKPYQKRSDEESELRMASSANVAAETVSGGGVFQPMIATPI